PPYIGAVTRRVAIGIVLINSGTQGSDPGLLVRRHVVSRHTRVPRSEATGKDRVDRAECSQRSRSPGVERQGLCRGAGDATLVRKTTKRGNDVGHIAGWATLDLGIKDTGRTQGGEQAIVESRTVDGGAGRATTTTT